MFGLTPLGVIHTAASLVAIVAAIVAFARHKEISMRQRAGRRSLPVSLASESSGTVDSGLPTRWESSH